MSVRRSLHVLGVLVLLAGTALADDPVYREKNEYPVLDEIKAVVFLAAVSVRLHLIHDDAMYSIVGVGGVALMAAALEAETMGAAKRVLPLPRTTMMMMMTKTTAFLFPPWKASCVKM